MNVSDSQINKVAEKVSIFKRDLMSIGISEATLMGCFVAGGCLRSILLDEEIKDVDIFCHNDQVIDNIKKELDKTRIVEGWVISPHVTINESDNAITFSFLGTQYQVIKVKTGQPMEVIGEFDFEMNMNFMEFVSNVPYFHNKSAILGKKLNINPRCRNKLGTLARLEKFLKRGYNIGDKLNLLELGCQISQLDPVKTMSQLEEGSKLYFTFEEFESINFVEKDETSKFKSRYIGSCF